MKVMFVARPDACRACRSMQGRVFEPREAPPLPLRECLTPPCRCRYEGYDPQAVVSRLLKAGMEAVKEERLEEAKELLYQVIDLDEGNEKAWLWLSGVVLGVDERIVCLENVLAVNPHHQLARQGLRYLQAQRRELGIGESAAHKIRQAREAIEEIKFRRPKVTTLREAPPPPRPGEALPLDSFTPGARPVREAAGRRARAEQAPVSFVQVFLYVLVATVFVVAMVAALLFAASVLR